MRWLRLGGALTAMLVAVAPACSDTGDPASGDGRVASVYTAALTWVLDDEPVPPDGEPADRVLFVASRAEVPINIDVQAAVIADLDDVADVRFIGARTEAIDVEADGAPPRDGGVIVGLGAVPPDGDQVELYLDRYRSEVEIEAWMVPVLRQGEVWVVDGTPTPTDVRPLPEE